MNELNYAIDNDEIKPKRKHPSPSVRHSLYSLYLPWRVNHAEEISKNMESDTDAENEINKNAIHFCIIIFFLGFFERMTNHYFSNAKRLQY